MARPPPPSAGQPSTNQLARYRARPFTQLTDQRFVDTGNFAAKSDDIIGLEAAGIFKSLHIAAEGQYLKANAYDAVRQHQRRRSGATPSTCSRRQPNMSPTAIPASGAAISRPAISSPAKPAATRPGRGTAPRCSSRSARAASGAFQVIGRVDYLDLDSGKLQERLHQQLRDGSDLHRGCFAARARAASSSACSPA